MFLGTAKFAPAIDSLCHFKDVIVTGSSSPYFLREQGELKKLLFNGNSMDDIAYQFAKKAGGKTIFDPNEEANMLAMHFVGGNTSGYKYRIRVPEFFK